MTRPDSPTILLPPCGRGRGPCKAVVKTGPAGTYLQCLKCGCVAHTAHQRAVTNRKPLPHAPGLWPFGDLRPQGYRVILMDAPTAFASGPNRNPKNHYQTMTIAEIAALPVGELAHPDGCRLIMWVTMPQLHRVPELLAAYGFRYCTARPWLKIWPKADGLFLHRDSFAVGCGYEVRNTSELQVVAKRGRPQRLGDVKLHGHIIAPRREHSRKPDCARDEIAQLFDGPRCELFARSRHPGFDSWRRSRPLHGGRVMNSHPHRRRYERAVWPDTVMSRAFLIALARWAIVHHADDDATVVLPIGRVGVGELTNVLRGLEVARRAAS